MSALPARDELHELVDHLDEPTAKRVLRLVKSGLHSAPKRKTGRVALPLIARDASPTVLVTNDDIAAALEAEDLERHSAS
jgi:hypothetical protein